MTAGFQEIVVSVFDIARFAEPFVEIGCYRFQKLSDAPAGQLAAWHVPPGCHRIEQAILLPENEARGWIRLVRFHGVSQAVMRSSQRSWDTGGILDMDIYAVDVRASYAALQRMGWTAFGEPLDYSFGDFHVCEVLAIGPAGIPVALIQAYSPPMITLPEFQGWSRAFNSALIVSDYARTRRFFLEGLDWRPFLEVEIEDEEPGHGVLGIPRRLAAQTRQEIGIFHPRGTNDGSVEPIALNGLIGQDFAACCVAPNVGYLCYRFPVHSLDAYADVLRSRGIAFYTQPMTVSLEPYGEARLFSVRTPDGAIIEFYEPASTPPVRTTDG